MKMVSSQSALFRFLTFPHAGGTVYIWRSHCVCFYWIFGCASHQIFNRIIWCFRQSAVNHGLSRGCTPAGPPQCCEDVAYFRRCCRCIFTMKVVFQRDVFKKIGFPPAIVLFFLKKNSCALALSRRIALLLLPVDRQLCIVPRFRQSICRVETLKTPHPTCPSMFEIFQQLILQVFLGGSWLFPPLPCWFHYFKVFHDCSNPLGWENTFVASSMSPTSGPANVAVLFLFLLSFSVFPPYFPFFSLWCCFGWYDWLYDEFQLLKMCFVVDCQQTRPFFTLLCLEIELLKHRLRFLPFFFQPVCVGNLVQFS